MGKRITVLLDEALEKKLRLHQAKLIYKTKKSVPFSKVVNDTVKDGLKNGRVKFGSKNKK